MKDDFNRHKEKMMQDEGFRRAYEELRPQFETFRKMIDMRIAAKLSQEEAAKRAGMSQAAYSRIESGNANPTIATMDRIARVFGKRAQFAFV